MTQEPYTVSILVPVYGVEKYIERCARSIFEQTYHNLDIVFIDDCTPDKSIEILKRVLDDYPERKEQTRIIRHEQNRGLSAARNTAVAAATGTFLTHVDSDDWLERDAVEEMVKKQVETGAEIVTGQCIRHNPNSWFYLSRPALKNHNDFVLDMESASINHSIWGRLIRKTLFDNNNVKAAIDINIGEDLLFMSKLAYFSKKNVWTKSLVYHYNFERTSSYTQSADLIKQVNIQVENVKAYISLRKFFIDKEQIFFQKANEELTTIFNGLLFLYLQQNKKDDYKRTLDMMKSMKLRVYSKIRLCGENFYLLRLMIRFLGK